MVSTSTELPSRRIGSNNSYMNVLQQNKGILLLGVVIIGTVFAYNSFFSVVTTPGDIAPSAASVGADLIKVADNLSRAMLSRELFSTSGYRSLADFSKPLELEPLGRANPFAPLGQ